MIKISVENAKPDFVFINSEGYVHKVKVMGKRFYFIEFYPNDDLTDVEPYLVEPKELIETFADGNEDDRKYAEVLKEAVKNISVKIARMRNA